jgi:16S rRNA (uracil1498-N3)-methyltransferase
MSPPLKIVLIQGILKGDRMDLVIQKTTELGVWEIFPVITERTQIRHTRKLGHWRRVAEEATRQSGRLIVPEIHDIYRLDEVLNKTDDSSRKILFYEEEVRSLKEVFAPLISTQPSTSNIQSLNSQSQSQSQSKIYYMVGPEGGFTEDEVRRAKDAGFIVVGLGRRILRSETASIAGTVLLQFLLGDIG